MEIMIGTPRTDAAVILRARINNPPNSGADQGSTGFEEIVTANFARKLERELSQALAAIGKRDEALKVAIKSIRDDAEVHRLRGGCGGMAMMQACLNEAEQLEAALAATPESAKELLRDKEMFEFILKHFSSIILHDKDGTNIITCIQPQEMTVRQAIDAAMTKEIAS